MQRSFVITGLAGALILAIAVPALAGSDRGSFIAGLADRVDRALERAREADRKAERAQRKAERADQRGQRARADLRSTRIQSDVESARVTTPSEDYVALGGPEVTLTVPRSGYIEVWAKVRFHQDGAVALFEDGELIESQARDCTGDPALLVAFDGPIQLATPTALGFAGCGGSGPAGPMLLRRTPGEHTYELRYADVCSCTPVSFSNRSLRIGPRL